MGSVSSEVAGQYGPGTEGDSLILCEYRNLQGYRRPWLLLAFSFRHYLLATQAGIALKAMQGLFVVQGTTLLFESWEPPSLLPKRPLGHHHHTEAAAASAFAAIMPRHYEADRAVDVVQKYLDALDRLDKQTKRAQTAQDALNATRRI